MKIVSFFRFSSVIFVFSLINGLCLDGCLFAFSQTSQDQTGEVLSAPESIKIGLSTETIAITSNFGGTDLTIFGALDNTDPMIRLHGRYDIVVVLQGPENNLVVRKKERYLGVWINTESETFLGVPLFYLLTSTRNLQDITDAKVYHQLSIGIDNFYLASYKSTNRPDNIQIFDQGMREIKKRQGLYNQRIGGVEFISSTLFRATLSLPTNVPVGQHKARALLFRNGVFLREASTNLQIVKVGFEYRVYEAAQKYSFLYGLFAVFLAVFIGWFGRLFFRKD